MSEGKAVPDPLFGASGKLVVCPAGEVKRAYIRPELKRVRTLVGHGHDAGDWDDDDDDDPSIALACAHSASLSRYVQVFCSEDCRDADATLRVTGLDEKHPMTQFVVHILKAGHFQTFMMAAQVPPT